MSYTVGQVIYLLSRKDIKVYPVQVIEEVTRKTIEEELVSYVIKLPDEKETEVILDAVDAEVFTTIADVELKMMENASKQIKSFLEGAEKLSKVFKSIPPLQDVKEVSVETEMENTSSTKTQGKKKSNSKKKTTAEVDLGNGITGKINLSSLPV